MKLRLILLLTLSLGALGCTSGGSDSDSGDESAPTSQPTSRPAK